MPQGEAFFNPYRWVPVPGPITDREAPAFHHRFSGVAGRIDCTLEALTPFLINDGHHQFLRNKAQRPYVPGTSLKGLIRSLVELLGNAAAPFPHSDVDEHHQLAQAAAGGLLDVAARMFGYLQGGRVFTGLVRFSDGAFVGDKEPQATPFPVAGGTPKPEHQPFYPSRRTRKLYHHNPGAASLRPPHANIKPDQKRIVRPLPPGVCFRFAVHFANLRDDELALLLYALALEEQVTVTLSAAALGRREGVEFKGPLRHKFGYGKPQGGGSVHIRLDRLALVPDPAARYRGGRAQRQTFEGEALRAEVTGRTAAIVARRDPTMQALRAMLVYSPDDPRAANINYPTYAWFQEDKARQPKRPLKPTL
jgi:hypothetical protein